MVEHQALDVAVLRHQGYSAVDRIRRVLWQPAAAVDLQGAMLDGTQPKDRLENFGTPAADQSGQPVDLAFQDRQVDIAHPVVGDIRQRQNRGHLEAAGSLRPGPRRHRQRPIDADDRIDQPLHVGIGGDEGAGIGAVAQHGHALRDLEDFIQPMRHIDHADAAARHLADRLEQDADLVRCQRGRRLIENQQPHLAHQRLRDLRHLAIGKRQRADGGLDIEGDAKLRQERLGLCHQFALPDEAETGAWFTTEQQIVGYAQGLNKAEVLIDDGDPRLARLCRIVECRPPARNLD